MMDFGYRALILGDPKDEYQLLCRALGVEPFRIGPGLPTRINPLAFGPLGDGWNRLDSEEALNRAAIVFGRWLTLVCGLLGSQRIGNTGSRWDPATRSSSRPHCSTSPATATVTAAPTYREPQPVTGAAVPAALCLTSPFRRRFHPIYKEWRSHNGQDLSSLPNARPVVATAAGSVISGHLEPVYGNIASLRHGNGVVTRYGHLASIDPKIIPGPRMVIGQQIGSRAHRKRAPDCTFTSRSRSTALRSTRSGSWPIAVHPLMERPLHRQGKQYRQFRSASPGRIRRPVWGFLLVNYLPVAPRSRA
jgi:hypothetical protein